MSNLYFTICAVFVSILLMILFFSKEKIKNLDNKIYSGLLLVNFFDCIFMILVLLIGNGVFGNNKIAILLNKFDFFLYIFWAWLFFIYTLNAINVKLPIIKTIIKITTVFNVLSMLLIFFMPLDLYNVDNVMYAYGTSVNFVYAVCFIYAICIISCMLSCFKIKDIIINGKKIKEEVLVGISDNNFNIEGVDLLLHKKIIKGEKV